MACVRKRRDTWVLDYRDHLGVRRWKSFPTRAEADRELSRVLESSGQERRIPTVDRDITVEAYAAHWLGVVRSSLKASTHESYDRILRRDVLPVFGKAKLRTLRRGPIKALLSRKMDEGLSRDSVRLILAALRVMLNAAWHDDEILNGNPTEGLARVLRLAKASEADPQERVKAFEREQLDVFLETARRVDLALYPALLTMARAGLRIGEALALRWESVDLDRREIRISEAMSAGRVSTTKAGRARTVDVSLQLLAALRIQRTRAFQVGSVYVFPSEAGTPLDVHNVGKRFRKILKASGLPIHFHPHCLRHTYASILLADGVSPAYVQEQLGHASIELTVGTYGRWLRKKAPGAVDGLDEGRPAPDNDYARALAQAVGYVENPNGSNLVESGSSAAVTGSAYFGKLVGADRFGVVTREGLEPSTQRLRVRCDTSGEDGPSDPTLSDQQLTSLAVPPQSNEIAARGSSAVAEPRDTSEPAGGGE
jgi:integrase